MNLLYTQDISDRLHEFKTRINNHQCLTQREIIEYSNLMMYDMHRIEDTEIKNAVEKSFKSNIRYLDLSECEFAASFPVHYMQRIFELTISDFISKNFELLDRKCNKSIEFSFNSAGKYFGLECVTRSASQMDKFYSLLPHFDKYYRASMIIYECHQRWIEEFNITNSEWYFNIDLRWHDTLNENDKAEISSIFRELDVTGEQNIIDKINHWIYYCRYACLLYKYLIPENLWLKFDELSMPRSLCGVNTSINDYALNSIVQVLLGKLKKSYFASGEATVVAISLSTFAEFMYFEPMEGFINYIELNLCSKLLAAINKDKDWIKLTNNLKNLYAILVDTNSYNWFPEIAKARYGAVFSESIPNYFGIIYNKNLSGNLSVYLNERIFDSIVPFCTELPLGS